ncbi:hypothetical protein BGZ49_006625, partial [Haplosporangium sp. Z 27]
MELGSCQEENQYSSLSVNQSTLKKWSTQQQNNSRNFKTSILIKSWKSGRNIKMNMPLDVLVNFRLLN